MPAYPHRRDGLRDGMGPSSPTAICFRRLRHNSMRWLLGTRICVINRILRTENSRFSFYHSRVGRNSKLHVEHCCRHRDASTSGLRGVEATVARKSHKRRIGFLGSNLMGVQISRDDDRFRLSKLPVTENLLQNLPCHAHPTTD